MRLLPPLLATTLLCAAPAAAQDEADFRVQRRQVVAGWTVRNIAENDGGRLIELRRTGQGVSIRYLANFWRGNGGELRGVTVTVGDCGSGDREALINPDDPETEAEFRQQLRVYLAECRVSPRREAALLRGVERGHCLFSTWAAEAAADMEFEIAQIVAHGTGDTRRRPEPNYPACRRR